MKHSVTLALIWFCFFDNANAQSECIMLKTTIDTIHNMICVGEVFNGRSGEIDPANPDLVSKWDSIPYKIFIVDTIRSFSTADVASWYSDIMKEKSLRKRKYKKKLVNGFESFFSDSSNKYKLVNAAEIYGHAKTVRGPKAYYSLSNILCDNKIALLTVSVKIGERQKDHFLYCVKLSRGKGKENEKWYVDNIKVIYR